MFPTSRSFLDDLRTVLDPSCIIQNPHTSQHAHCLTDRRARYTGRAQAIVYPRSTQEVSDIVQICQHHLCPIVCQGGNTGLCGGATPDHSGTAILLSLKKMNRVRTIEYANNSAIVEAGVVLADFKNTLAPHGFWFPLSLPSEKMCTVGGTIATNAGGTSAIRYGVMREQVLGLEVVLADGSIWSYLTGLRKNNMGYDLKHLFIGSEGTLGVITAAHVILHRKPLHQAMAWLTLSSLDQLLPLMATVRHHHGAHISAVELLSIDSLLLVQRYYPHQLMPAPLDQAWHLLVELSDTYAPSLYRDLRQTLDTLTAQKIIHQGFCTDEIPCMQRWWEVRLSIPYAEARHGPWIKHDISVPLSAIPDFITHTTRVIHTHYPHAQVLCFAHVGDGNLHYNITFGDTQLVTTHHATINRIVYAHVQQCAGSISAEHGIGQLKCHELAQHIGPAHLALMHHIKNVFDPNHLLNPGKLFESSRGDGY